MSGLLARVGVHVAALYGWGWAELAPGFTSCRRVRRIGVRVAFGRVASEPWLAVEVRWARDVEL